MIYALTMTQNQASVLQKACSEYEELRWNKWKVFVEDVGSSVGQSTREQALEALEGAMRTALGNIPPSPTDEMEHAFSLSFKMKPQLLEMDEDDHITLEMDQGQTEFVQMVLEEYFRLRLNQWFEFATEVACNGYVYDKEDPDNGKKFSAYLKRRDASKEKFEKAMQMLVPRYGRQTEDMLIAQDIWQVIRYRLYLDNGGDPNGAVVDARPPMQISQEPLPKFIRKKEGV